MPEMIQINFERSFPVFPLAQVCLLPHAQLPLHIFEPRYVQMVTDSLDGSGQIAMAVFSGEDWKQEYHGNPPIRPIVCVGQIEDHMRRPDGRYNIALLGVCRARVVEEFMPDQHHRYRTAKLAPLETNPEQHEDALAEWRERMRRLLERDSMTHLQLHDKVVQWFESDDIPTHVLVEIVGHCLMTTVDDAERRYRLLSEASVMDRASMTERELRQLGEHIQFSVEQIDDWPKGMSWN